MIECKVHGDALKMQASGTPVELFAEVMAIINGVYDRILAGVPQEVEEDVARMIRKFAQRGVREESPVWERGRNSGVTIIVKNWEAE